MIIDNIKNASRYYRLGPGIETALRFLAETDLSTLQMGKREIQGEEVFAIAQQYETRPAEISVWEAHRAYIDVQYVVSGKELMGYANLETMAGYKIVSEYDAVKDVLKFEGRGDFVTAGPGTFLIFTPEDAHMPCIAAGDPDLVRKVVIKVRNS